MDKISLLIFSRNDLDHAWSLIEEMKTVAGEIILMDSSDSDLHGKLLRKAKTKGPANLKVYRVPALGYPDPLRMYGLSKCKNEWVFLVDTDERLCASFKKDLTSIIKRKCDAFAIRRYELASSEGIGNVFTWQTRLFRKSRVLYKGLLHEQPIVSGVTEKLEEQYYLEHRNELRTKSAAEYIQIERFDRLSYGMYNERMLEYLAKVSVKNSSQVRSTLRGRIVLSVLRFYEQASSKQPDQELSGFDYWVYCYVKTLGYIFTLHTIQTLPALPAGVNAYVKRMQQLKERPDSAKEFEISKIVNDIGITAFLTLDKESTIVSLNERYGKKKQGINLLIKLLIERYDQLHARGK
jgi:hypothetical protein